MTFQLVLWVNRLAGWHQHSDAGSAGVSPPVSSCTEACSTIPRASLSRVGEARPRHDIARIALTVALATLLKLISCAERRVSQSLFSKGE